MSEYTGKTDGTFRIPIPHLALGQKSFDEVMEVFKEHSVGKARMHKADVRQTPRLFSPKPAYRVESTFTHQETLYVSTALSYLNRLLAGGVYGQMPENPPLSLRDRIVANVASEPVDSLEEVAKLSVFDVFDDFRMLYPNLMPAFSVAMQGVGVQGVRTAIHYSALLLKEAREGIDDPNKSITRLDRSLFAKTHPRKYRGSHFEIQCSGEIVARTIITQTDSAVKEIIEKGNGMHLSPLAGGEPIDLEIHDFIEKLFLQAHYDNRTAQRSE